MANPLFNMFRNPILQQYRQIQSDPGKVLDIMLQNGKINYQQYNEMQQFRNNPQMIASYLINHGNSSGINQAEQIANSQFNK